MKSLLLIFGGIILGIGISIGGGYLYATHYIESTRHESYQPDWMPEFDEEIYDSAAKLTAARSDYERWVALGDVAFWSVDAGFLDNAKEFANEQLRESQNHKDGWNYGNAVHKAHLTLGRLALREDNIPLAIEHLLEAGRTPGSPQLDSFGPNMTLAFELLKAGEKDAVLEYFRLCAAFWEMGGERLEAWSEIVEAGEIPRFGANLRY